MESILKISKDGKCLSDGCNNWIKKDSKAYCDDCKMKRKEYFQKQHYEKMGWNNNEENQMKGIIVKVPIKTQIKCGLLDEIAHIKNKIARLAGKQKQLKSYRRQFNMEVSIAKRLKDKIDKSRINFIKNP